MDRIIVLEAQVQALAAAWLHLAAQLEMHHGLDRQLLGEMLRSLSIEAQPGYRQTLHQLAGQLDQAAEIRALRAQL